ncbi:protein phosphatase 2C domain-containing protein [Actinoplanes sp. M2I2]|uniref:protein phosphatase 2C domain-containing protein n=1 Tax=Actinoplanes sp. M2I2 TaxID=1734444 RepID=UPI002020B50D|nr:protein phosphatase 2C domain-containing protein [Actinoplanes sp. M2I2]
MHPAEFNRLLALFMLTMLSLLIAVLMVAALMSRKPRRPRQRWWQRWRPRLTFRRPAEPAAAAVTVAPGLAAPPTTMPVVQPPPFRPASPAPAPRVPPAARGKEPPLPPTTIVDCRSHAALFHGWCAPPGSDHRMHVRGAAWRGGMHCADGSDGQDAVGAAWDPATGALFVAVADGLGSLPASGPLAREAVRASLKLCLNRPGSRSFAQLGPQLFTAVADGLLRHFGPAVSVDAGTTLVVAELVPAGAGVRLTVHGVGDSEGWVLHDGRWSAVHVERGAAGDGPVSSATRDLPTDPSPRTGQRDLARGDMLLLATDGFAEPIGRPGGWTERMAAELRAAPAPLEFLRVVAQDEDDESDDRGVVAVWVG